MRNTLIRILAALAAAFLVFVLACSDNLTAPSERRWESTTAVAYNWYQGSDGRWCRMEGVEEVCLPPGEVPPEG